MKARGHVISEKKIVLCFTHDPPGRAFMDPSVLYRYTVLSGNRLFTCTFDRYTVSNGPVSIPYQTKYRISIQPSAPLLSSATPN